MSPPEDASWQLSWRMLSFLVPGLLPIVARRGQVAGVDGLTIIRQVWLSFAGAVVLIAIVVPFAVTGASSAPVGRWLQGLSLFGVGCLVAEGWALRRPLTCSDETALASSYRSRFFLAMALSEVIGLAAFVGSLVNGRAWLYWMFAPLTLIGFARAAPTRGHLEAAQHQLDLEGCPSSLVRAMRATPAGGSSGRST